MGSVKFMFVLLVASGGVVISSTSKCDRTPEGSSASKSPPDGRFRLKFSNDPVRYSPGETYSISLEGVVRFGQQTPPKFSGFFVTVEKDSGSNGDADVGSFQIVSTATSKFSEKCNNLVTHTSSFPKNEVQIEWTAPQGLNAAGCVAFKSTVIEHRDVWFSDDGALSKILCKDEADSGDTQPPVLGECTACDEAKYELTFEGSWSRHTHPKDFPDNGWLTKFSDVIGASHTNEFMFWKYGEPASDGLKELAEHGSTQQLERELKDEGEHIRTIIKARGISYPNATGKTFAVFRVDSNHHLVSLVSMIYPSPDWFVGVSGLELCLNNGSWVEQKILNLYPYDAGTDSGPTYISSDQPTHPPEAIRRIKPNQPNDPRSPFHDPENKEMQPLAKLYLTRQRLYEKNCENAETNPSQERGGGGEREDVPTGRDCDVTKFSDWSECDQSCGKGTKTRQREFRYPDAASEKGCRKKLEETEECQGTDDTCNNADPDNDDPDAENQVVDPNCELTDYEEGDCSKQCGKGTRTLTRKFAKNHRNCIKKHSEIILEKQEDCEGQNCLGDISGEDKQEKGKKNPQRSCKVSNNWSQWSKCSTKCWGGRKIKVRVPTSLHARDMQDIDLQGIFQMHRKLTSSSNSKSNRRKNNDDDDDDDDDENEISISSVVEISDQDHPCHGTNLVKSLECGEKSKSCSDGLPEFCKLKPDRRNCGKDPENHWYYKGKGECGIFTYTGCTGNQNKFESEELCMQSCKTLMPNSLRSFNLLREKVQYERVDCETSHWKHEKCNVTCGEGFRWKFRSIIQHPQNGGLPCPKSMVHFERCYKYCGGPRVPASQGGNHINSHHHHHHQCKYSEWSAWSPCSKTCGDFAVQIRTRTVLNHPSPHLCTDRLEERRCEVMPCLVGSGYGYNYNYRT